VCAAVDYTHISFSQEGETCVSPKQYSGVFKIAHAANIGLLPSGDIAFCHRWDKSVMVWHLLVERTQNQSGRKVA